MMHLLYHFVILQLIVLTTCRLLKNEGADTLSSFLEISAMWGIWLALNPAKSRIHFQCVLRVQMCICPSSFHKKHRCCCDVFMCSWCFGGCWRHLKQWTKTSPVSSSALSIYLRLKVDYWPSLYDHVTFPNNGKALTERWACGEFPSKQKAILSQKGLKNTRTLCSGVILPALLQ